MELYPLKFEPIFKYRIWGGEKLRTLLNKEYSGNCIGESWELSGLEGDETVVNGGPLKGHTLTQLIDKYKGALIGEHCYQTFGNQFPLLIKCIDTAQPLSVQVHPSDEVARKKHGSFGKNEMWYVLTAEEEAELIIGFKQRIDKSKFLTALSSGKLLDMLNIERVGAGDVFDIPTGRIHAIGKGVTLIEIQQTSDATYRVFDYDRIDKKTGKKRELHIDEAVEVIDYSEDYNVRTQYKKEKNVPNNLIHARHFKTNFIPIQDSWRPDLSKKECFHIYICVEGSAVVRCKDTKYTLGLGETIFIPACIEALEFQSSDAKLIEVFL